MDISFAAELKLGKKLLYLFVLLFPSETSPTSILTSMLEFEDFGDAIYIQGSFVSLAFESILSHCRRIS